MKTQRNEISFKGQSIYAGIDVHLKSWSVAILSQTSVLKKFRMDPNPEVLHTYLTTHYPEADFYSVYEAGFCGFWIHDRLTSLGIRNIVVNPADVPTTGGERLRKTDSVDSVKLARSLRLNELKGIYTPDVASLEIRSLIRLKNSITKDMTRQKNRIKSTLRCLGVEIPKEYTEPFSNWSKRFILWLREVQMNTSSGRDTLNLQIEQLEALRKQKLMMTRKLRALKSDRFKDDLDLIMSVPGIGMTTGMALLAEICDVSRFTDGSHLAAYIGMTRCYHLPIGSSARSPLIRACSFRLLPATSTHMYSE